MKKLLLLLPLLLLFSLPSQAQQASDPCFSAAIAKSSVAINFSSATTASLVAPGPTSNSIIYVCGFSFTITGSATATFTIEAGTGATCGGSTVALTGAYAGGTTPVAISGASDGAETSTPAANRLCGVAGGTTPSVQGLLSYVVQG